jgi:sirohydrochlorin ferrochelatase
MNALLIISHGSRRAASNEEVFRLTDELRKDSAAELALVACAFLEIAEPKVQSAIDELVEKGATEIRVFPHFLAAGTHVARDIPRELEAAEKRHSGITFTLLPHLGALPGLSSLILKLLADRP